METVKPNSGYNPIRPFKAAYLILGLILAVAVGLAGWFYLNQNKKVAAPVPPVIPKTTGSPANLSSAFSSFEGTVVSASGSALVVKGTLETKTFSISPKTHVQKQASTSAAGKMQTPDTIALADLKAGQAVFLLIDKKTGQVTSVLAASVSSATTADSSPAPAFRLLPPVAGVVTAISQNSLTVKSGSEDKTFAISDKVTVQNLTATPAKPGQTQTSPALLSDVKTGERVIFHVDKTNRVFLISMIQ